MSQLLGFVSSYALIVLTPGPNLAVVLQASLSLSRRAALLTASGIAGGAGCLSAVVFGLARGVPLGAGPMQAMSLLYGAFLIHAGLVGLRRPRGAARGLVPPPAIGGFRRGFLTAAANPVSALFFAAAAVAAGPGYRLPLMVAAVVAVSGSWFALTAFCATSRRLGALHRHAIGRADPVIGAALVGFGGLALLNSLLRPLG